MIDRTDREGRLTRREVLEILGAGTAGLVFLSACGTSGGQSNKGPKQFNGAWPYQVPPNGHYNVLAGVTNGILSGGIYIDLLIPPLGMYYWKTKKWLPLLAEKWSFDKSANTFSLTLKQGLKWSDGKTLTSKDVVSTLWCLRVLRNQVWDYIDTATATDDHTVTVHMSTPSTVVERYVLKTNVVSDAVYGQWATRAQALFNGGGNLDSTEGKALNQDLQNFRPDKVTASGPFVIDENSITNSQMSLNKNSSGLNADKVLFDKVVLYNGETPVVTPIVLAKKVDYATHGFPPATAQQFAQEGIRVLRPPVYSGYGMYLNVGKLPEFQDKRARQALAYAVDRNESATVTMGKSAKPVKYMTGFSDLQVPDWLSPSDIQKLNTYQHDTDKATQLLQAAGWKKSGSQWMTPSGQSAQYEMIFPAEYADTSASGQNWAEQLGRFGIKITPRSLTFTQHPIEMAKGNFQFAAQGWGSSSSPHPHFAFVNNLFTYNYVISANQGGRGMDFDLKQTTDAFGPVDLQKLVVDAGLGLDESAQKKNVTQIAIAYNELLPNWPLSERYGDNPALEHVRVQGWPADSDPVLQNAPYGDNFTIMLMYTGDLKPV